MSSRSLVSQSTSKMTFHTMSQSLDDISYENESQLHKKSTALYRKVRVAIKQTNDYIQKVNELSEHKLKIREINNSVDQKIESDRLATDSAISKVKVQYVQEVDKAIEEKAQIKAQKQYHLAHVNMLLPSWCLLLNEVQKIVAGKGHSDKMGWRSSAKALLQQILSQTENDTTVTEITRSELRRLILTINALRAQELIRKTNNVKYTYIENLQGDSELARHQMEYVRLSKLLEESGTVVPLSKSQWSHELESMEAAYNSTFRNQMSLNGNPTLSTIDDSTLDGVFEEKSTLTFSRTPFSQSSATSSSVASSSRDYRHLYKPKKRIIPVTEKVTMLIDKNKSVKRKLKALVFQTYPNRINDINIPIYKEFRDASSNGNFEEALGLFHLLFKEHLVLCDPDDSPKMKSLTPPPTIDDFKLLFLAYKNSSSPYDASKLNVSINENSKTLSTISNGSDSSMSFKEEVILFDLMKLVNVKPDVQIMNILLRKCEQSGSWRKSLQLIEHIQKEYEIAPNTHSFDIIIDCCRHVIDEPSVIYETLRSKKFPSKFCYQAAACNAGNRIPVQVINDAYTAIVKPIDLHSSVDLADCSDSEGLRKKLEEKRWRKYYTSMTSQLQSSSPAKFVNGPSSKSFVKQMKRLAAVKDSQQHKISNLVVSGKVDGFDNVAELVVSGMNLESSIHDDDMDESNSCSIASSPYSRKSYLTSSTRQKYPVKK